MKAELRAEKKRASAGKAFAKLLDGKALYAADAEHARHFHARCEDSPRLLHERSNWPRSIAANSPWCSRTGATCWSRRRSRAKPRASVPMRCAAGRSERAGRRRRARRPDLKQPTSGAPRVTKCRARARRAAQSRIDSGREGRLHKRSQCFPFLRSCCAHRWLAAPRCRCFPPASVWHRDIKRRAAAFPDSAAMLAALGGWGNGNKFQIDSRSARAERPERRRADDRRRAQLGEYFAPDYGRQSRPAARRRFRSRRRCDRSGRRVIPATTAATMTNAKTAISSSCAAARCSRLTARGSGDRRRRARSALRRPRWNLPDQVYPPEGRGEQCTSADAASFPVAPLLFNAEAKCRPRCRQRSPSHAIRFILPSRACSRMCTRQRMRARRAAPRRRCPTDHACACARSAGELQPRGA